MKRALVLLAVGFILASCKSVPTEIDSNLSKAELIQMAQESADSENWSAALAYYQAVLDRYPQDREATVSALYEIAFIHYKRNDREKARAGFEQVIAVYDFEGDQLLQWPRVLAQRFLDEIATSTQPAEDEPTTAAE